MTHKHTKADLFQAMGLGPVWELKNPQSAVIPVQEAVVTAGPALIPEQPAAITEPPEVGQKNSPTPATANFVSIGTVPSLSELHEQVKNCQACGLCDSRRQVVFADGVEHAPLMVVGEAPGADEDASGLPFVGRAGQLLDRMLKAVGSSRKENVYIANVLKCRPPGNRNPEPAEIEQCAPHLLQQIAASQPKVLLLVGKFAIQTLLQTSKPVGEMRGRIHQVKVGDLEIPAVVSYHPAYLLRRPEEKAKAWDDLLLLKQLDM
ncbi:MAG TPA: uracil-DNA glycosylase [Limnobacter sp.]|nr:uracil-DNA glycosylase [Limnobacter sp.]